MDISLLELSNGHLSLEFAEADLPRITAAIQMLFGNATETPHPMAIEIIFGGTTLIYQDEWNDPCLISTTPAGDRCLRRLHAELTRPA